MAKEKREEISKMVFDKLDEIERNLSWLSRKANIPYGTLYSTLVQKTCMLSESNLEKINKVLEIKLTNNK